MTIKYYVNPSADIVPCREVDAVYDEELMLQVVFPNHDKEPRWLSETVLFPTKEEAILMAAKKGNSRSVSSVLVGIERQIKMLETEQPWYVSPTTGSAQPINKIEEATQWDSCYSVDFTVYKMYMEDGSMRYIPEWESEDIVPQRTVASKLKEVNKHLDQMAKDLAPKD